MFQTLRRWFGHSTIVDKLQVANRINDFDCSFYYCNYPDLRSIKSPSELEQHYIKYGFREGRMKNFAEAQKTLKSRFGALPTDFDLKSYRLLNSDLMQVFDHDWQFTLHYLASGRREGRRYKFEGQQEAFDKQPWVGLFRRADFVACAHKWLDKSPATEEDPIRIFINAGIERLAPINLDHFFDPFFYRTNYEFDNSVRDAELYRHWLEIGYPVGWVANEAIAIGRFVQSRKFPASFEWQNYRSALSRTEGNALHSRVDVLEHLFNVGFEQSLTSNILGPDAYQLYTDIGDFHLVRRHFPLAIAAYDRALALNAGQIGAMHRRGDAYLALGKNNVAYSAFACAAASPHASVWSHIHAADAAAAEGNFKDSFSILALARPKWVKSADYRSKVKEIIEQFFAAKTQAAMTMYEAGEREAADALLSKALDEIRNRIMELEDLPPVLAPVPGRHIAILANQDLRQCKHYRVEQKLKQLEYGGFEAQVFSQDEPDAFISSLLGARAAIFYRVPAFPTIIRAILTASALGIPTYCEHDDLIFDANHFPDTFKSYGGKLSKADYNGLLYGVPLFRYAMSLCDHGIASTTKLAAQMRPIVQSHHCFVVRNGLDERNEKAIAAGERALPERNSITIFYGSGTKAHNSDFNDLAGPAILSAMARYRTLRLVIIGYLDLLPEFDRFASRITRFDFVTDVNQYWSLLAASDINLSVLSPGVMSDCKSEIKWLEAAILQVPSIVSGTATHREIVEDGVDALVVDDCAAWKEALNRLIVDRALRRSIGASARRKALQNYSLERAAEILREELAQPTEAFGRGVAASKEAKSSLGSTAKKIKVLVCHVFFSPQSFGGATRVVQDNVDYIKDHCADIELSVFASDEGISPPGRLRFDQYRGIPVFRLSTPAEPNMDWRAFNAENEAVFERVLDAVQPDLVHFHCIQRLTASIVEVALRRKVSYLITAHDGWWISDYQFFVDGDGVLRLPSSNLFDAVPPSNIRLINSVARRQRLARLLDSAVHVIGVSDAFAEIYRRGGCQNVIAIPNGVSPIVPVPRLKQTDGRLSLGHIGDRSVHKGAILIEGVLRTTHFDHLKLTMIDNKMEMGARLEMVWGNTPVVLTGPYPQDKVAELYASLDVLLAPSTWPESFGLVAREAIAQGLWVIASNQGSIGECVTDGENGFVIDVSDGRGLAEILRKLDANVARYQLPPPRKDKTMRSAADQGRDVVELYRKIYRIGCGVTGGKFPGDGDPPIKHSGMDKSTQANKESEAGGDKGGRLSRRRGSKLDRLKIWRQPSS